MHNIIHAKISAVAKASLVTAAYFGFLTWSYLSLT